MSDEAAAGVDEVELVEEHGEPAVDPAVLAHIEQLEAKLRVGANWFFWIAALSTVNAFMILSEANRHFLVGLGITELVNGIAVAVAKQAPNAATIATAVAVVMTFMIAGVVALFGLGARKRMSWVFILGMTLYALDGLLFVLFGDWLSIAFHVVALLGIFRGLSACRELHAMEA